jgi:transcriptional regulator with XRE-family HTH domain
MNEDTYEKQRVFLFFTPIKELCEKKNISQYEFVKKFSMIQSSISSLLNEGNVPKASTLKKICNGDKIAIDFMEYSKLKNLRRIEI